MSECVSNRRCVASQAACKRLPPQPRGRCCVASQAARIGAVSQAPQLLSRVAFFRVSVAVLWRAECIGDDASSDTPSRGPATEDLSLVENSLFTVTDRVTKAVARTSDGRQEYSPLHIFRPPPNLPTQTPRTHAQVPASQQALWPSYDAGGGSVAIWPRLPRVGEVAVMAGLD